MGKRFAILLGTFVALGIYLTVRATHTESNQVYTPSELAALPSGVNRSRIRVVGRVAAKDIHYEVEPKIELEFFLGDPPLRKDQPVDGGVDGSPLAVAGEASQVKGMSAMGAIPAGVSTSPAGAGTEPGGAEVMGNLEEAKAPPANGVVLPVVYRKIKPDMFMAGRDVIIDGNYVDGTIEAVTLLTQCPSKYEPPDPKKMKY